MSKKTINKDNNAINIIKHPLLNIYKKNINESFKTTSNNHSMNKKIKKPIILKFIKNNLISKAIEKKHGLNQTSRSTYVEENLIINEQKKLKYLKTNSYNNKKSNKNMQPISLFNNALLNHKYNNNINQHLNKLTKVKDQYLRLNNVYSPNIDYSEVVHDKKQIIETLQEQTKTNFNNNYYLVYYSPNKHKRNYISKCFENIKNINGKNIDGKNSIKTLAEKVIFQNIKPKLFKEKKINKKKSIHISIPSSFDIDIPKSSKFKIQTLNIADNILREYEDPLKIKKKKRLVQSTFLQNDNIKINFFRTLSKNKNNIIFEEDNYN